MLNRAIHALLLFFSIIKVNLEENFSRLKIFYDFNQHRYNENTSIFSFFCISDNRQSSFFSSCVCPPLIYISQIFINNSFQGRTIRRHPNHFRIGFIRHSIQIAQINYFPIKIYCLFFFRFITTIAVTIHPTAITQTTTIMAIMPPEIAASVGSNSTRTVPFCNKLFATYCPLSLS